MPDHAAGQRRLQPGDPHARRAEGQAPGAARDEPVASILLVDDYRPNLIALESVLEPLRQRLVLVESGEEALEQLNREEFAVILLDVQMKGLDGFQTAARVKGMERARYTPIIFISALQEDETRLKMGYEQGAVDYVFKPISPDILRAKVAVFVELHCKTAQIKRQEAELRNLERQASDEVFRRIMDTSMMGLVFSDQEGRILDANDAFLSMLGYTRDDLAAGRVHWKDLSPPEYRAADERERATMQASGVMTQVEKEYARKDGTRLDVIVGSTWIERQNRNITYVIDISQRKRAETNARFLAEAGELLSSSLDYLETLRRLADLVVPTLADWCAVDVLETDGSIQRVAVRHVDPAKVSFAMEIERRYPMDRNATVGVPNVLRTGETEWAADIPDSLLQRTAVDEEHLRLSRALGLRSFIMVPLEANGRVLGALTLVQAESGRRYGKDDVQLAEELGRRAALRVENALLFEREHRSRSRLDAMFMQVPAIVGLIDAVEHRYLLANPGLRALCGGRPLVGRHVREAHPELAGQGLLEDIDRVFETGKAFVVREHVLRLDRDNDGQLVDGYFDLVCEPMLSPTGATEAVLLFAVDVTDKVQARRDVELLAAELKRSEEQFRTLAETMPQLVWASQPDGRLTYFNQRWYDYTGLTHEEAAQDEEWSRILHPDDRAQTMELWRRSLRTGERYENQCRLRRGADGAYRWFIARALPSRDAAGQIIRWFGTCTDIDGQKRAEEERQKLVQALERSNKDLDQFAYVTSHDLKAPLRGIANLSQWIEEDLSDNMTQETRDQMSLLRGRVHRLESLIDGILSYSRAGRVRDKPEEVHVAKLLAEVVELLSPPPGARVELAPDLPVFWAERVPLQQCFLNLIGNALKHADRADPVVRIGAHDAGERWEFSVADNGPGIAAKYHERIWGIFQTLKARDKVEGTGIGLSVVRRIVQSQGGRAWVESQEGAGATFFFTWPKRAEVETDA